MKTDWGLQHLYHTVVNCKDIAESVRFYELLGFEIEADGASQLADVQSVAWDIKNQKLTSAARAKHVPLAQGNLDGKQLAGCHDDFIDRYLLHADVAIVAPAKLAAGRADHPLTDRALARRIAGEFRQGDAAPEDQRFRADRVGGMHQPTFGADE